MSTSLRTEQISWMDCSMVHPWDSTRSNIFSQMFLSASLASEIVGGRSPRSGFILVVNRLRNLLSRMAENRMSVTFLTPQRKTIRLRNRWNSEWLGRVSKPARPPYALTKFVIWEKFRNACTSVLWKSLEGWVSKSRACMFLQVFKKLFTRFLRPPPSISLPPW